MSPASKAAQKAVNKYMKTNYDRINLTVPKGKKEEIKAVADFCGESVNAFINRAIDDAIGRTILTKGTVTGGEDVKET